MLICCLALVPTSTSAFWIGGTSPFDVSSFSFRRRRRWRSDDDCSNLNNRITTLQAYSLTTSLEWLYDQRLEEEEEEDGDENHPISNSMYKNFQWIDLQRQPQSSAFDSDNSQAPSWEVPLYPLPAVHLPVTDQEGFYHYLNNVEPRNIQMTIDLMEIPDPADRLFCVVLSATDTGKVANIGTLLRLVDIDPHESPDEPGKYVRVRVACQTEGLVRISNIVNPQAAAQEQRIRRSSEYLCAQIQPILTSESSNWSLLEDSSLQYMIAQIVDDYKTIKLMYQLGIWSHKLPPNAMESLASGMPDWTVSHELFGTEALLWTRIQEWQAVCYTIREGQQSILAADRNELLVEAASAMGGPLKLPIHPEDVRPEDRKRLEKLELQAQEDYWDLGLDPLLDFQVLLSLQDVGERLQFFSKMIKRERSRMEIVAKFGGKREEKKDDDLEPPKGAWFDDDVW